MLYSVIALSLIPAFAAAQTVHTVQVSPGGGFTFNPVNVPSVSNNDIINFVFASPGHSVTQSSLATPCEPLEGGFNSGFATKAGEQWNLTITDASKPIWYFCAQSSPAVHCSKGMVGAIGSDDTKLASFTSAALVATDKPSITAFAASGSGAFATADLSGNAVATGSGSGSGSGSSGSSTQTSTGSSSSSSSTSAASPAAGFESLGLSVLALIGAALF